MTDRIAVRAFATAVLAVLAVVLCVYFLNPSRTASSDPRLRVIGYTVFRFPTHSMEPAIRPNDMIVVSAWAYSKADPQPGDVVAFQFPLDRSVVFAKRVIAAGGSKVEFNDGITFINGKRLDEPYVDPRNNVNEISRRPYVADVPADAFFVMGDNRDNSDDSRSWGFVPRNHIVGKVSWASVPNNRWRVP